MTFPLRLVYHNNAVYTSIINALLTFQYTLLICLVLSTLFLIGCSGHGVMIDYGLSFDQAVGENSQSEQIAEQIPEHTPEQASAQTLDRTSDAIQELQELQELDEITVHESEVDAIQHHELEIEHDLESEFEAEQEALQQELLNTS